MAGLVKIVKKNQIINKKMVKVWEVTNYVNDFGEYLFDFNYALIWDENVKAIKSNMPVFNAPFEIL